MGQFFYDLTEDLMALLALFVTFAVVIGGGLLSGAGFCIAVDGILWVVS